MICCAALIGTMVAGTDTTTFEVKRCGEVHIRNVGILFNNCASLYRPLHESAERSRDRYTLWRERSASELTPIEIPAQILSQDLEVSQRFDLIKSTINPPDNAMAVGARGHIVCAINSRLVIADTSGGVLFNKGLEAFFSSAQNGAILSRFFCDPRVIYDRIAHRFIVMAMTCEGLSSTSQILLAVSQSDDPTLGWWVYQVRSTLDLPFSNPVWFDFPNVSTTENDVFISSSLFDDTRSYRQAVVLQIRKAPMLNGDDLTTSDFASYAQLEGEPYGLYPAPVGNALGNTNMLMISNGLGNDDRTSIDVYEFSGSLMTQTTVRRSQVTVPAFQPPGFSRQLGSTVLLTCFDQRGSGAAWIGSSLHYVHGVGLPGGLSGIRYLVLQREGLSWKTTRSATISRPNTNLCYPSVAPIISGDDMSVILAYTFASASEYPGIAARLVDSSLNISQEVLVRGGDGPVTFQSIDDYGRWADYIAVSPDPSRSNQSTWLFAPYGATNGVWTNLLARLTPSATSTSVSTEKATDHSSVSLSVVSGQSDDNVVEMKYRSNIDDLVDVALHSVTGSTSEIHRQKPVIAGENTLYASVEGLPSGLYLLTCSSSGGSRVRTTFVITR